jgi:tRNA-guanine family transglycosylase
MKNEIQHKKNPINLTPEIVFKKQCEVGCDLAIQLDHPLSPFLTKDQQYATIDKTIRNFEILLDLNENAGRKLTIMPVAHGYCDEMIEYCVQKYEDMLGKIPLIGIGSLVPMVKSIKGTKDIGGKWKFIDNLIYLRRRLPNSLVHAFGIGGTMTYLAFYCGVDSLDSNGWVQKSGYGVIQLPGISDRFLIKKPHNRPYLMNNRKCRGSSKIVNEIDLFMACKCPICSQFHNSNNVRKEWKTKVELFDAPGEPGRLTRAVHNVSVFNDELELLVNSIKTGNLDEFIEERLFTTSYSKLYQYAKCLKNNEIIQANMIKNNEEENYIRLDSYFN